MPPKVFVISPGEQARQDATVELIASENFESQRMSFAPSARVSRTKYAEGYPPSAFPETAAATTAAARS